MLRLPFLNKRFPKFKPQKWESLLNFEKFRELGTPDLADEQVRFFLDLVDQTLVFHPDRRISIEEVLAHPFLAPGPFQR